MEAKRSFLWVSNVRQESSVEEIVQRWDFDPFLKVESCRPNKIVLR